MTGDAHQFAALLDELGELTALDAAASPARRHTAFPPAARLNVMRLADTVQHVLLAACRDQDARIVVDGAVVVFDAAVVGQRRTVVREVVEYVLDDDAPTGPGSEPPC